MVVRFVSWKREVLVDAAPLRAAVWKFWQEGFQVPSMAAFSLFRWVSTRFTSKNDK